MITRLRASLALAVVLLFATAGAARAAEHERPQPRVVVADGANGTVRAFDVANGKRLGSWQLAGAASLTTAEGHRYVLAAQTDENRVDAIDAGAWSVPHGDHEHHHTATPRLLPFRLSVRRPVHVTPHGDEVAIFADGSGEATVYRTSALRRRASALTTAATGRPHHGAAVPLGGSVLVTEAAPDAEDGALPFAVTLRDSAGAVAGRVDGCPELHGEVAGQTWAAFGCADGILVVRPGGQPLGDKIPYPARTNDEQRAFTLHANAAGTTLVGDYGDSHFIVVDLASKASRVIASPKPVASFAVDADTGAIVALTTDGLVRRIDPATGRQLASRRAVSKAFTPSWERPSPKLAVAGGMVAVSDPGRARVRVLRAQSLRVAQTLRVPGDPTSVALAGTR